jgi:hypothetical protein
LLSVFIFTNVRPEPSSSSFRFVNFPNIRRRRKAWQISHDRETSAPLFQVHTLRRLCPLPAFIFQDLTNLSLTVLYSLYRLHLALKALTYVDASLDYAPPTNVTSRSNEYLYSRSNFPHQPHNCPPLSCIRLPRSSLYNLSHMLCTIPPTPLRAAEKQTWERTL